MGFISPRDLDRAACFSSAFLECSNSAFRSGIDSQGPGKTDGLRCPGAVVGGLMVLLDLEESVVDIGGRNWEEEAVEGMESDSDATEDDAEGRVRIVDGSEGPASGI